MPFLPSSSAGSRVKRHRFSPCCVAAKLWSATVYHRGEGRPLSPGTQATIGLLAVNCWLVATLPPLAGVPKRDKKRHRLSPCQAPRGNAEHNPQKYGVLAAHANQNCASSATVYHRVVWQPSCGAPPFITGPVEGRFCQRSKSPLACWRES